MAQHKRENNELKRAAADASALLGARKAARTQGARTQGARDAGSARAGGKVQVPADRKRHVAPARKLTLGEFIVQNAVYIVAVAAVAALVAVMLVAVRSCVPTETYDFDGELDFYYESPFDWNNLDVSSGRYAYVDNGKVRSRLGIDVSENQDEIDWDAVAADGVEFAMIRLGYRGATEGDLYLDARFEANLKGAQAAGIDCGVYFFSQAVNAKEAKQEAEFVIKHLDGAKLAYPVAFDFEASVAGVEAARAAGLGKDEMTEIAATFCKRIQEAGLKSMLYGNYYDLDLYHYKYLQQNDIWWAEYDVYQPSPNVDIVMWQYANGGWVDGISTAVDMNIDLSDALG